MIDSILLVDRIKSRKTRVLLLNSIIEKTMKSSFNEKLINPDIISKCCQLLGDLYNHDMNNLDISLSVNQLIKFGEEDYIDLLPISVHSEISYLSRNYNYNIFKNKYI